MEFLIRFPQIHERFRIPEIEALAIIEGVDLQVVSYSNDSPFCIVRLPSSDAARALVRRAVLVQSIHELWGSGATLPALHASVHRPEIQSLWPLYASASFKFTVDSYQGKRSEAAKLVLINAFAYLSFAGAISLRDPEETFTIFEEWAPRSTARGIADPEFVYLGRLVGAGARHLSTVFDLKQRRYISTTSMDSTLSLVGANIALAAPGKLFYDPFAGTGGLPLACARFGAVGWGSDIDGRALRGEVEDCGGQLVRGEAGRSVRGNFEQYGLLEWLGDLFTADLTNSPVRRARIFDGIACDPPYGVREGLRVLGARDPVKSRLSAEAAARRSKEPDYVPPKKQYGFMRLLDDILQFAAETLVDDGRLSFWMPTANDEEQELPVPANPHMEFVVMCVQPFGSWSRRLITYRRIPDSEVDGIAVEVRERSEAKGITADDLNPFRRAYFSGFQAQQGSLHIQ